MPRSSADNGKKHVFINKLISSHIRRADNRKACILNGESFPAGISTLNQR